MNDHPFSRTDNDTQVCSVYKQQQGQGNQGQAPGVRFESPVIKSSNLFD